VANGWSELGPDALPGIARLVGRAVPDPPTPGELARTLFDGEQPAHVVGDPAVGVVATVVIGGSGHLRLLAVDPDHRGRGHGRALLAAAEAHLAAAGCREVVTGSDPPAYLFPGVDTRAVELCALLERSRYRRDEANFNMVVDLDRLPADPGGWEDVTDEQEVRAWGDAHWPHWTPELVRAARRSTLIGVRDAEGLAALCAYSVNRDGWVGPVCARPSLVGRGAGRAPLVGALVRLAEAGHRRAEIAWVGPIVPYARLGARIGPVFFVYRRPLGEGGGGPGRRAGTPRPDP
jgi:GNAT superfamily N-acetyltransferase